MRGEAPGGVCKCSLAPTSSSFLRRDNPCVAEGAASKTNLICMEAGLNTERLALLAGSG